MDDILHSILQVVCANPQAELGIMVGNDFYMELTIYDKHPVHIDYESGKMSLFGKPVYRVMDRNDFDYEIVEVL